ncbi:deoxyribose-phosphate aldolase [Ancylostoma caninum]|uniref:deoxyribose-phosphate aldolase n=1 Tax=Ancylostoma caninum TaxID=29170 RepID=A0A368FT98_ANCCA|nr:deoxyribose-phosphate aldolase [Ancylostoma caninum]
MATLVPMLFSFVKNFMSAFDQAQFDKEVSRDFDTQEIASATARYEKEAAQLVKDKAQVKKVIGYIDLTTLAGDDTKGRVVALVDRALNPVPSDPSVRCAAVCVYPQRVADVSKHLAAKKKTFNVASVAAGFPSGQYHLQSKLLEVQLTVADGATEIDIVISRAAALEDDWKTVYNEVAALKSACGNAHMKTILATGELKTLANVYKASWASILAGSDFIKTSTGKESTNATLEVAYVMCAAIKRWHELTGKKVGFKPAGGIKTPQEALAYVALIKEVLGEAWLTPELFRIGASSLLDNCLKAL